MSRSIATVLAMVLSAAPVLAQAQIPKQTMPGLPPARDTRAVAAPTFPSTAARFWDIGYEIAHAENITGPEADQAIILLTAAKSLNNQLVGAEPLLLKLATRHSEKNYSDPVVFWLQRYVSDSADRVVVSDAIRYLLNRASSRGERKTLLDKVTYKIKNKNAAIDSDLATSLGLLTLEQGDTEQAKWYFVQAYNNNKFNRTAFAKLAELAPNEIGLGANLEHLRLMVRENPLDLDGALAFAGYAERLQLYDVAAGTYWYCADLFRYLYPSDPLPSHIYLPLAVSCYNANTRGGLTTCLEIAKQVRSLNRFDIVLEAIAGRAALKMGSPDEARQIFQQAEQKVQELLTSGPGLLGSLSTIEPTGPGASGPGPLPAPESASSGAARPPNARQLAWFYSFADPNAARALDWANKAYSAEPNSPSARALLAYALSINNRLEFVRELSASSEQSQVAGLALARVQLAAGNRPEAVQTIKAAIERDAGSLAAETAKEMLRQLGSGYTPLVDPRPLAVFLADRLGKAVVPKFLPPDQMIDVQFMVRGSDSSYGRELEGAVAIVNKSPEPLIITENGLFQGNIRVSARVSGDLKQEIPNLASETIRTNLTLLPGKSLVHTLRLSTGELRDILLTYPQANLQIQFTLYLDPVVTAQGEISNRLLDLKPVTAAVIRPPVQITGESVRSQFNSIASGREAQKVQTALVFTGLLKEQHVMMEKGVLYPIQYRDWLPGQLRLSLTSPSGLLLGGGDGEWTVKVNTMADMLSLPLDQELAGIVLKNLNNHPQWPVRLMAVYLLGKNSPSTVGDVLAWVAQNDKDELVRSMALSLQSASSAAAAPRVPPAETLSVARP